MGLLLHRIFGDHKWKTVTNEIYNHVRVTIQECEVCGDRKTIEDELP